MFARLPINRPVIWAGLGNRTNGYVILQPAVVKAIDGSNNLITAVDTLIVEMTPITHYGTSTLHGIGLLKKINGNPTILPAPNYNFNEDDEELNEILVVINTANTEENYLLEGCTFRNH